ncbi:hypothetical protein [Persicitalea sp.]|uniref:hypothetical protein n=1 Tax=Persicitalea sp. TaxID=3100273 RepID=UPI0035935B07
MKSVVKLFAWLLVFLPVVLLLSLVYHFSETAFYSDDFHLLKTIVWAQETNSFTEKFQLLVQQHNEHRILVPRLITWLNYKLLGHIDWPILMLSGNLLWCGVLYFLWTSFRQLKFSVWYFLPIPWLLFQPAYYDNYTWSISVLQQSVIVFLLAWLVHSFVNRRYILALFIFLIGTFTHGNGIFGIAVGVVFLFLYREWKWLGIWLAVCLAVAAFYFYGFEKGQNANFLQSLASPVQLIGYFFAFFGASAELLDLGFGPSVLWGLITFGGICGYILPKIYQNYRSAAPLTYFDKMLLGNLLFLSITALLVSVSRSWSSPDLDIPPRYAHYSPYLSAWFYLVGLVVLSRFFAIRWATIWGAGAILYNLVSHLNYVGDLEYRRDWLRADYANWQNYETFLQYPPAFNDNIREVYAAAIERGICQPIVNLPKLPSQGAAVDSSITLDFEELVSDLTDASSEHQETELLLVDHNFIGSAPFLVLVPDRGGALWIPFYRGRNGYRKILTAGGLRESKIWTRFFSNNLPSGVYRIGYQSGDSFSLTKYRLEVGADHAIKLR